MTVRGLFSTAPVWMLLRDRRCGRKKSSPTDCQQHHHHHDIINAQQAWGKCPIPYNFAGAAGTVLAFQHNSRSPQKICTHNIIRSNNGPESRVFVLLFRPHIKDNRKYYTSICLYSKTSFKAFTVPVDPSMSSAPADSSELTGPTLLCLTGSSSFSWTLVAADSW